MKTLKYITGLALLHCQAPIAINSMLVNTASATLNINDTNPPSAVTASASLFSVEIAMVLVSAVVLSFRSGLMRHLNLSVTRNI